MTKTKNKSKHTEGSALQKLSTKKDCKIVGKIIRVLSPFGTKRMKIGKGIYNVMDYSVPNDKRSHDLGNGSWGRIDFLVKYCGYKKQFVTEL